MSRIGKEPITVPTGAKVAVEDGGVRGEGPKGKAEQRLLLFDTLRLGRTLVSPMKPLLMNKLVLMQEADGMLSLIRAIEPMLLTSS